MVVAWLFAVFASSVRISNAVPLKHTQFLDDALGLFPLPSEQIEQISNALVSSPLDEVEPLAHDEPTLTLEAGDEPRVAPERLSNAVGGSDIIEQRHAKDALLFTALHSSDASKSSQSMHKGGNSENQRKVEQLIADKLGNQYKAKERPIPDDSAFDGTHKIKIFMGLSFRKLLEVDQIKQTMSIVVWQRLMWPDYRLAYNSNEYLKDMPMYSKQAWNSSTDFVPISQDMVWKPDLQVFNAVEGRHLIWEEEKKPHVFWYDEKKLAETGYNMVLVSPQILHVQCPMKLKDFPFDVQTCEIQFGDWSAGDRYFDIGTIDDDRASAEFAKIGTSTEFATEVAEFSIETLPVKHETLQEDYLVTDQGIPVVSYSVRLARRPHFYILMIVLPLFLLVLLGQGLYWMDLAKERLSTGITVILAVMAVGFLTEPMLPKTPEILWIESLMVGCYVLTCLPMFFSVLLDYAKTHEMLTEEGADNVDSVARVVHPLFVILFYLIMFGLPGLNANKHNYFEEPELVIFATINYLVFTTFFVTGLMRLPYARPRKSAAERWPSPRDMRSRLKPSEFSEGPNEGLAQAGP